MTSSKCYFKGFIIRKVYIPYKSSYFLTVILEHGTAELFINYDAYKYRFHPEYFTLYIFTCVYDSHVIFMQEKFIYLVDESYMGYVLHIHKFVKNEYYNDDLQLYKQYNCLLSTLSCKSDKEKLEVICQFKILLLKKLHVMPDLYATYNEAVIMPHKKYSMYGGYLYLNLNGHLLGKDIILVQEYISKKQQHIEFSILSVCNDILDQSLNS